MVIYIYTHRERHTYIIDFREIKEGRERGIEKRGRRGEGVRV